MFLSFIKIVACIKTFLFMADWYYIVCILPNLLICLSVKYLGCCYLWLLWVILLLSCIFKVFFLSVFISLGYMSRIGITGSFDNSLVNFIMNHWTSFHMYRQHIIKIMAQYIMEYLKTIPWNYNPSSNHS